MKYKMGKKGVREGDFRDWTAIRTWAEGLGSPLLALGGKKVCCPIEKTETMMYALLKEQASSMIEFEDGYKTLNKILRPYIEEGMTVLDIGRGPGLFFY